MDNNVGARDNRFIISFSALLLAMVVAFSLLYQFVSATFLVLGYLTCVLVRSLSKPYKLYSQLKNGYLVACAVLVFLIVAYFLSNKTRDIQIDIFVLFGGIFSLLFVDQNVRDFSPAVKIIKWLALFYAIGVFLQALFPGVYRTIVAALFHRITPGTSAAWGTLSGYRGFTSNTGFTAGYLCMGLIVILSEMSKKQSNHRKKTSAVVFLIAALLLTAKRGHTLFLLLSLLMSFLLPVRGEKKLKRLFNVLCIIVGMIAIFFLFRDLLSRIPLVGAIVKTINGIALGEDVTTGRSILYSWAWLQFKKHPLFGIGWGAFRRTTAGNATFIKELDAHNIYLQLLCETGVVGFAIFTTFFLHFWNTTKKAFCALAASASGRKSDEYSLLFFSLTYQSFFLLYGLSGNPLYDQTYQIVYCFSCLIASSYVVSERSPV